MDYIAMCFTAAGIVLTGRMVTVGWVINAIGSAVWLSIAVRQNIWGLAILNVFLIIMALYNFKKWFNHKKQ